MRVVQLAYESASPLFYQNSKNESLTKHRVFILVYVINTNLVYVIKNTDWGNRLYKLATASANSLRAWARMLRGVPTFSRIKPRPALDC